MKLGKFHQDSKSVAVTDFKNYIGGCDASMGGAREKDTSVYRARVFGARYLSCCQYGSVSFYLEKLF